MRFFPSMLYNPLSIPFLFAWFPDVILTFPHLWTKCVFALVSSRILSLSLVFCSLNKICLGIDAFIFCLLGIPQASQIYDLVSVINFGKFPTITSKMSLLFFLLLLVFPSCIYYTFCNSHSSSLSHSFSCLHFSLGSLSGHIFKFSDSCLGHVQSTDEPIKDFLRFGTMVLISQIAFGYFLRISTSLFTFSMQPCMLLTFFHWNANQSYQYFKTSI